MAQQQRQLFTRVLFSQACLQSSAQKLFGEARAVAMLPQAANRKLGTCRAYRFLKTLRYLTRFGK